MRDGHSRSLRYLKVLRARRRDRFAMGGGTGQGLGAGGWLAGCRRLRGEKEISGDFELLSAGGKQRSNEREVWLPSFSDSRDEV
jgi:hypothetical protein